MLNRMHRIANAWKTNMPSPATKNPAMITIVDYQMGNLRSVQKAIERVGGQAQISSDASEIASADKLILPGVGAFGDAMAEINRRHLATPIRDFIDSGKPFFGICLGLQLLFEQGFENGQHEGLGLIAGDVVRFAPKEMGDLKVPHMGWNTVQKTQTNSLAATIADGTHFYFVHSYFVRPTDPAVVALQCEYGHPFCAAIGKNNVFATQFHPEKSQADGLKLLHAFVEL
jgi:glutamine amidotransferase